MIRINLLPVRAAKRKESLRIHLTIAGLVTFFVVAVLIIVVIIFGAEVSALNGEIATAEKEKVELERRLGELKDLETKKTQFKEKLEIIDRLEAARTGPVELFVRLEDAVPEDAHIVEISETTTTMEIRGLAATQTTVANFMRGLRRHPVLGMVALKSTRKTTNKETGKRQDNFILVLEKRRQ